MKKRLSVALVVFMLLVLLIPAFSFEGIIVYANATSSDTDDAESDDIETAEEFYTKVDFTGNGIGFTSFLYDNSNGLPTSEANDIAQTSDGFIWIGSYSGLIRYDGNDFIRYDSSTGIASVVSLYVDSKDRLWIGTNDNGVAMYQDGEFTVYGQVEGLNSYSIRSMVEDSDGNIIIATTQGMAYVDTENEFHLINEPQVNNEYVCELRIGPNGVVYGETLSGAIFTVEDRKITAYYSAKDMKFGTVNCIYPDPYNAGYVYVGTDESEVVYGSIEDGLKDYTITSVLPQVNINAINCVDGIIWLCADNGIGFIDAEGKYTQLQNIKMNNSIDEMIADYEGNLWFVSSRQGVLKLVECRFTDINKVAGLDAMVVNTTCKYNDNLYLGTDEGLYIIDKDYNIIKDDLTEVLEGVRIRSIKTDSKGNLWLCTYSDNGLVKYDGKEIKSFNMESGISSNRVRTITELSDGTMAVATSGGLNIVDKDKVIAVYDGSSGINNTEILTVCEGTDGKIYLGSDGDGIYVIDNEMVSRIGLSDGLKSGAVLRIKYDVYHDVYWIITSNSISYMKDGEIKTVDNFPYSNNFDMIFKDDGVIWILSSNGIYVVNGEDLMTEESLEYTFYNSSTGLPYVTTANSRNYLDEDGTLYISCSSGICSVNLNESEDFGEEIKLAIPMVEVDGKELYVGEDSTITIPANTKRLTVYGYALTYSIKNPSISSYLEGFDEEPEIYPQQDMEPQTYTNLDAGTYTYHFAIVDPLTRVEQEYIELTIVKKAAFHETIWFYLMIFAIAALVIATIVKLYITRKTKMYEKKQQENKKFINEMISAFGKCIDMKDKYTNGHSFRVAKYTELFARNMGYSDEELEDIYNIALLHDIGKISIPDNILGKQAKLTDEEYAIIKSHAQNGYEILKDIEIMPNLSLGAGCHHERIDGKGYPRGLKGDEIPPVAKIIAVADTFDAMYSSRPYRKKMKLEDVMAEINRVKGTQLSEEVVEVVNKLYEEGELDKL